MKNHHKSIAAFQRWKTFLSWFRWKGFTRPVQKNGYIGKDTKEIYSFHGNKYTKERHQLHEKIVDRIEMTSNSIGQGERPIAFLMGGGTASGKTTLRKTIIEKKLAAKNISAVMVDIDEIKEYIPEYASLKKTNPEKAASFVHKEAYDIGALLLRTLMKKRKNFIYEGTMARTRKYKWLIKNLKKNDYEIHAYIVDVPLSIAIKRADERARVTGRKVPLPIIINTHKLVPRTFETIKGLLDHYQIYDNQNQLTLIASHQSILNPTKYDQFLKKGKR
ncbi:zeta toxin family protein [Schinkia sp. CFF1]